MKSPTPEDAVTLAFTEEHLRHLRLRLLGILHGGDESDAISFPRHVRRRRGRRRAHRRTG